METETAKLFTKMVGGVQKTRWAYTRADVVKMTFEGWVYQPPEPPKKPAKSTTTTKPAGDEKTPTA
jgi:hypothetical protein